MLLPAPCPACSRGIRHDLCAGPPCPCMQCHTRDVEALAHAHLARPPDSPLAALLACDVASLLSLATQRRNRRQARMARPMAPRACACGRLVNGQPCMIMDARQRNRRYASHACIMYAYRRRQAIAKRAQLMAEAAGQAPYGWDEHWSQTGEAIPPGQG